MYHVHVSKMVEQLIEIGVSERDIATECDVAQTTINRIRNGKVDPRYSLCERIAGLYSKHFPDTALPDLAA